MREIEDFLQRDEIFHSCIPNRRSTKFLQSRTRDLEETIAICTSYKGHRVRRLCSKGLGGEDVTETGKKEIIHTT
jgi:hypothetical protein